MSNYEASLIAQLDDYETFCHDNNVNMNTYFPLLECTKEEFNRFKRGEPCGSTYWEPPHITNQLDSEPSPSINQLLHQMMGPSPIINREGGSLEPHANSSSRIDKESNREGGSLEPSPFDEAIIDYSFQQSIASSNDVGRSPAAAPNSTRLHPRAYNPSFLPTSKCATPTYECATPAYECATPTYECATPTTHTCATSTCNVCSSNPPFAPTVKLSFKDLETFESNILAETSNLRDDFSHLSHSSNASSHETFLEDYIEENDGGCACDLFEEAFPSNELSPSSCVELCHSKHNAPSLKFNTDSACKSSNSASDRSDVLKLLNKASCYEILTKVSMFESEIMLQHLSLETPTSYYKDNILELEKSIGDSFRSTSKK